VPGDESGRTKAAVVGPTSQKPGCATLGGEDYGCLVQANDPVIDDVLRALHRIIHQTKRTVASDTVERAGIIILSNLKENNPRRLSDLANDLWLDISTVSRQARSLEDRGLVTRTEDPDDRRAVRLQIAPAGLEVLDEAWSRRNRALADSLHDWAPEDRAALVAMLSRLADSLTGEPTPNRAKTETPE
jgi:DNA-binding MarR family transcriptional regulator